MLKPVSVAFAKDALFEARELSTQKSELPVSSCACTLFQFYEQDEINEPVHSKASPLDDNLRSVDIAIEVLKPKRIARVEDSRSTRRPNGRRADPPERYAGCGNVLDAGGEQDACGAGSHPRLALHTDVVSWPQVVVSRVGANLGISRKKSAHARPFLLGLLPACCQCL